MTAPINNGDSGFVVREKLNLLIDQVDVLESDPARVNTIESTLTGEPTGSTQVPNIVTMSQAQYDAAVAASTIVDTTLYVIV